MSISTTQQALHAQTRDILPETRGETVDGSVVNLPDLFVGHPTFIVAGFAGQSESRCRRWRRTLNEKERREGRDDVYQITLVENSFPLLRELKRRLLFLTSSRGERERTILLERGGSGWGSILAPWPTETPYILILDNRGAIYWRTDGDVSDEALLSVFEAFSQMTRQ